jgi:hypothetical protein
MSVGEPLAPERGRARKQERFAGGNWHRIAPIETRYWRGDQIENIGSMGGWVSGHRSSV